MKSAIRYFLNNSFVVNLLSAVLILTGVNALITMKRDLIPSWELGQIQISAGLVGGTPKQIEKYLLSPIEDALVGLAGIKHIQSSAVQGSMSIYAVLKDELSNDEAFELYQKIETKVKSLTTLPDETSNLTVSPPSMDSFWFSSLSILNYDFKNEEHRNWLIKSKEQLRRLPGLVEVRDTANWPSIFIRLKPQLLSRFQIKPEDIFKLVKSRFYPIPLGQITQNGEDIRLEMQSDIRNTQELGEMIIRGNTSGNNIKLKDLAEIEYGFDKIRYFTQTNGVDSADLILFKDLETDTIDLKTKTEALIESINKTAPKPLKLIITGDGPAYIERQLSVLKNNGLLGLALVLLTLYLFLGGKSAAMTSLGLPLAYFSTFIVLNFLNINIDLISVVGMILILGILVDDAIIVAEQYVQYLEMGLTPKEAAFASVKKTLVPITGTIMTSIVAFLPILMSTGGLSKFLYAIPCVVIASLAISWFESFFILPNHLYHFVKRAPALKEKGVFSQVKSFYTRTLHWSLRFRYPILALFLAFSAFSLYFASKKVPMSYDLRIGSEKVKITAALKSTKSIEETKEKLSPLFKELKKIPTERYSYMNANYGSAWYDFKDQRGIQWVSIYIRFNQTHPNIEVDKAFILEQVEQILAKIDHTPFDVLEVQKAIEGKDDVSKDTLTIFAKGRDMDKAPLILKDVETSLENTPGIKELKIDPDLFVKTWEYHPDAEKLKTYQLSHWDIGHQLRHYVSHQEVHEFRYRGQLVSIYGQTQRPDELTLDILKNLPIVLSNGREVPSERLGQWKSESTLKVIRHRDLKQTLQIQASFDPEKTQFQTFKEELEKRLITLQSKYPLVEFSAENSDERAEENKESLFQMLTICLLLIYFVLALVLRSLTQPFLIMLAIPFGVIGVIWAFYFHGSDLEVMAMVGVIGMAGVVVNDSLIMVDTINHLRSDWLSFGRKNIIEGAVSRLRPILLTSITTLGGVFPMAYGIGGDAGFTRPLALSMGWGLLFATVLTLVVLPCLLEVQRDLFTWWYRRKNQSDKPVLTRDKFSDSSFLYESKEDHQHPVDNLSSTSILDHKTPDNNRENAEYGQIHGE